MTDVLVSIPLESDWRDIIVDLLGTDADLTFLDDLEGRDRVSAVARADALLSWNPHDELDGEELAAAADAEFLQLMSAGADHLDFETIPESLTVACNPGAYAEPVAEHVLAMTLALARRLREEHENLRNGQFNQRRTNDTLRGATLGIVGFGGIGREIRTLFEPFDVDVMAINTSGTTDVPVDWCGTLDEIEHLLRESDVVVLSIPLKDQTQGLIDASALESMQDDAVLINVARGELIDQGDLYEHLQEHPEFRAGLEAWWTEPFRHDTFETDYPFLDLPNVLGCPHNSAVVPGALQLGVRRAAENLRRELRWDEPAGIVDRDEYTTV